MTPQERQKLAAMCDTQGCQDAIKKIEIIKNTLILIYQQHMLGNQAYTRGMVERAKLIVEQYLEGQGIELDYKKPKEEKKK